MDKKETISILLYEIDNLLIIARDFVSETMNREKLKKLESFIEDLRKCDSDSLAPRPECVYCGITEGPELVSKLSNQQKGKSIAVVREVLKEAKEKICESY